MAIPEQFLDELNARTDILDVVSGYVTLNKKGANYWGLCPFHHEKTPSFSVSPDKQIFHCFGCGKGGGVIRFVMEMENLSFPDAVANLARRVGMEVPQQQYGDKERRQRRERVLALNKEAARFYHQNLELPQGAQVAAYIGKRRISRRFVNRFGLGAAADAWDTLIKAMAAKGYDKADLLEAGLAVAGKNGGIYDKFRNRLMLPVIDVRGDVIGFTSRVMDGSAPKYLNTPETALFKKRSILYGLNYAKNTKRPNMILVEGNIDVITLHQAGFDNAVATMGTALTEEHVRILSRYTRELVLCYDNDNAGKDATQRAIALLRGAQFAVKVLQLPRRRTDGGELVKQDADDFIKYQGAEAFEGLLGRSENSVEYRLGEVRAKYDLDQDEARAAYLQEAAAIIAALPSPVEREIYGGRVAEAARVSAGSVEQEVERLRRRRAKEARRKEERQALTPTMSLQPARRELRYTNVRSARAEEGVLRVLLLDGDYFDRLEGLEPSMFSSPLLGKVYQLLLQRHQAGRPCTLSALEGVLEGPEMDHLTAVLQAPLSRGSAAQALEDYIGVIRQEAEGRGGLSQEEELLRMRARFKETKGYGGKGQ